MGSPFKSTFSRIVVGYVLVAVVLAGAWLYSLYGPLTHAVTQQQVRNLKAVAQSAVLLVQESDQPAQTIARQLVARTDLRLTIIAADGRVLADSEFDPAKMENHADRPEVRSALEGQTGVDQRLSATEGYDQLYVAVPGSLHGQRVAIRVAQSLEDVRRIAAALRRFGLLMLGLALGLTVLIAWRSSRSAAQPVQQLADTAKQMAAGDLAVHVPKAPSDLQVLADSLTGLRDQMRSRIEALDAERLTLQTAFDGITDAVLLVEGDSVSLMNSAAVRLADSRTAMTAGRTLASLPLPASLRAAIESQVSDVSSGETELPPDPLGRVFRVSVVRLQSTGPVGRSLVLISDVTDRSRLDKVRREFVSNASHELKTPVAAVKLLAESAQMATADGDMTGAAMFTSQILGEVNRIDQLVGDLLDLSRLEALPAPDSIADVRTAVRNVIAGHRSAAVGKGLDLVTDFSAVNDEDVFVAADPTDLAVALDNLVVNALSYTDAGSVQLVVDAGPDEVNVEVRDTGRGIAPEHLERIFERFYRVDQGRDRVVGGTGLGLALVKHAAERHGGKVTVSSEPGAGSSFILSLPRHR